MFIFLTSSSGRLFTGAGLLLFWNLTSAATITVQTNILGPTPEIIAYNSGHFYPGSNTRDWWRYAGVNGARFFISPSSIEPADDLAPVGDGVTNQAGFISRKAALRVNPLNTNYINWPYFTNHFDTTDLYPANHIKVDYALGELRKLGVHICAQITASESRFPITDTNDWGGKWELWQHYYADAFYLGRMFDVDRYQMYNEPNNTTLTSTNFLMRLQLVADAVQSALADVNSLYGKSLRAQLLAPTAAGNATSAYVGWGDLVVTNRHKDYLGVTSPGFSLIQTYDYHQYGATGDGFGAGLVSLNALLAASMAPEAPFPIAVTEFNTRTAASYDTTTVTEDSPADYSRFGSIVVNLMANGIAEMYAFKFSQVAYAGNYPVQKNALHYVDNNNAPYNIGGVTKAGEVYRLFTKAFAAGRNRLGTLTDGTATNLDVQASYDPVANCYYLFSANSTASTLVANANLAALNLPATNKILLEEVSENSYGGGVQWTTVGDAQSSLGTQPAYSAWLLTIPGKSQQAEQIITATDDAQARDGGNKAVNYGSATEMTVRNDPANLDNRSVAFIKFQLPTNNFATLQLAVLSLQASSATMNTTAQAHVYALTNTGWFQAALNWNNAPNLRSGVAAGNNIANGVITGQGTNACIVGQLITTSTTASEKLIDVTGYLRGQSNSVVSFLISQDPRWDVTLPSLAAGDTQPDGVKIVTTEGGVGPRLRLIFAAPTGNVPVWTNLSAAITANIRGGAYGPSNVDEVAQGYIMVKYYPSPYDSARKVYFQFNLAGLNVQANTNAVFTVTTSTATFAQQAQLWALNQAYGGFNPGITWNTAQANDTSSDNMLSNGTFTATAIGAAQLFNGTASTAYSFTIPQIGNYLAGNQVTLALSGVDNTNNGSGGLRLTLTDATLQVLASIAPPIITNNVTGIAANGNGSFTISFQGTPGQMYRVQATANLPTTNWLTISTNLAATNGVWSFTDFFATNYTARFYRSVTP